MDGWMDGSVKDSRSGGFALWAFSHQLMNITNTVTRVQPIFKGIKLYNSDFRSACTEMQRRQMLDVLHVFLAEPDIGGLFILLQDLYHTYCAHGNWDTWFLVQEKEMLLLTVTGQKHG